EAARMRPPAVSAVIRTRVFSAGGRAFFRGIRPGASARPRILADAGVAGLSLGANLASISGAAAGRVWSTGGCLGIGDAGLDGIGTGALGAGADSNFLVDEAGAGWGIETGVFVRAAGGAQDQIQDVLFHARRLRLRLELGRAPRTFRVARGDEAAAVRADE